MIGSVVGGILVLYLFTGNKAELQTPTLDLTGMRMTFSEEFDELNVSPNGPNTRWIAHTPWNGDFGDARFADPDRVRGFPFVTENGILRIEARKNVDGKWESGLLCSADSNGRGFSQKYGYFETRAKMPKGPGTWPAFWLVSTVDNDAPAKLEVDIIEFYGHSPADYMVNVIVHPKIPDKSIKPLMQPKAINVPRHSLSDEWNTYGALVDPEWIILYLNRKEVFRIKTPPEHDRPLQVLLNLGLGSGWPIDKTPNPSYFYVDYVHVYSLKGQ
jgi:beta-glucanase (GH16 family)